MSWTAKTFRAETAELFRGGGGRCLCVDGRALLDCVCDLIFAEEVARGCFRDKARVFQLEVGALDFAAVYRELVGERGGRGERVTGVELAVADERLDLASNL